MQDLLLKDKIKETREKLQNHAVAKKILDLMKELRSEATVYTERRWIWELLQNAKDVSSDQGISVKINLDESSEQLIFSHNGKPFSVENIVGLIEQIGTKERNLIDGQVKKTIGKFGTGFITTHLLSENVNVQSCLEEPENNLIEFNLTLNRSGRTLDEISDAVNISIKVLEELSEHTSNSYKNTPDLQTTFTYHLNESRNNIAKTGVSDLINSIPYTLAFIDKIKEIHLIHEDLIFYIGDSQVVDGNKRIITINKKNLSSSVIETIKLIITSSDNVQIAIPFETSGGQFLICEINKEVPRIFCEFPLVGTEGFFLPFVINCKNFNPTKDRNGISLTDNNDPIVNENKAIMIEAVNLFHRMLDYISNSDCWSNTFYLAIVDEPKDNILISNAWYRDNILKPIKNKILNSKIVDTMTEGRTSIIMPDKSTIDFPYNKDSQILEELWNLCNFSNNFIIPVKEDIIQWSTVKWLNDFHLTTEKLVKWIAELKSISNLAAEFSRDEEEVYLWFNNLIQFLDRSNNTDLLNKYAILPNQNGVMKNKDFLYFENPPTDNELKDIAKELGFDCRNELINENVEYQIPGHRLRTTDYITHEIERLFEQKLKQIPRTPSTKTISKRLIHWFNNNKEQAELNFKFLFINRHLLREDDEIIEDMQKADLLDKIVSKSGYSQNQIEDFVVNNQTIVIKVSSELYPTDIEEKEQEFAISDNSDERSRISISEEAKEKIFETLNQQGFIIPDTINVKHTVITGILKPDGTEIKVVAKSGKAGKLYFTPYEWLALTEDNSQLFVISSGNIVRNVTMDDLLEYNPDIFYMRFNTEAFAVQSNLKHFAEFFRFLKYTHFIFDTPESTSDYLEQFGLNSRNLTAGDLSVDDIKLLD